MDSLDQALESSQDKTNDSNGSDDVQLTGHAEGMTGSYEVGDCFSTGQVTYRVVQVTQDGSEATAQVVSTTGFPAGAQVAQAVIQTPFSNGGSPTPESQAETRFTYFPTSGSTGESAVASPAEVPTATAIGPVTAAGGQFYVMMSPQDVLQSQRNIAPRTNYSPKLDGRSTRDDRRRATHNEVERRRRDKINNWIVHLSKLVPECAQDHSKQGQVSASKGGILAKACEYIQELRTANARMADSLKETERISVDCDLHRQQCEELKQENSILRATLQQHGIVIPDLTGSTS
ncbi:upstream stimulatory factor 2 [Octopus bimaculoides]|uniref:BHLH domain-containing protein n=1 Tax=Octopus bimaculoides TaxID=37653 RepID=A0A0L8G1H0_OCTBM|nr:upstream stimulatory factor 2 [Octopus bimaculoides]|eukprot:XP_014785091.1 PREDICTED: upstream stimulatory factor 2-like [Octopus bimaculoides]